jgi:uncharacterized protein YjdB
MVVRSLETRSLQGNHMAQLIQPRACNGHADSLSLRNRSRGARSLLAGSGALLISAALVLAACGGGDGGGGVTPPPPDGCARTFGTSGGSLTCDSGASIAIPGGAIPSGTTVSVTVTQASSSGAVTDPYRVGDVFTFNPSGTQFQSPVRITLPVPSSYTGDVADLVMFTKALGGGNELLTSVSANATAISGDISHFSPFWVSNPPPAQSVTVTPSDPEVVSGSTVQLSAEVRDDSGNVLPGFPVTWASANTAVAEVETDGTVTGKLVGDAAVTATAAVGVSGSTTVTVVPGPASALLVDPATGSIAPGQTLQLQPRFVDAAGNTTTGGAVNWTSFNTNVATVSSSGLVEGIARGVASIQASDGTLQGVASITVQDPPIALGDSVQGRISVATEEDTLFISLNAGQTVDLAVFPRGGSSVEPDIQLTDPAGSITYVDFGWTKVPESVAVLAGFEVTDTGIWRIIIRGTSDTTGDYVLRTRASRPVLETEPTELLLISAQAGGTVVRDTLFMGNAGSGNTTWSADVGDLPAWVTLGSTSGTLTAGSDVRTNPILLTVLVDPSGQAAGDYNNFSFTLSLADEWGGPPRTIALEITLNP